MFLTKQAKFFHCVSKTKNKLLTCLNLATVGGGDSENRTRACALRTHRNTTLLYPRATNTTTEETKCPQNINLGTGHVYGAPKIDAHEPVFLHTIIM